MLIAWQTLNTTRNSTRFTDRFLIVAPGITVRDRLRVLLPADPNNTYILHGIVPLDLRDRLQRARIVITNYHAFKARETMQAPKLVKGILGGRDGPIVTLETEGLIIQRVCKDLLGGKRIMVVNDEAHHCYRAKADATKLDAETRSAVKKDNDAARLWISGLEALQRVAKVPVQLYDLSATPFYLRGSGEPEGTLFPWVVSDFSLIDAIECGIVKVPRVPVQDVPGADLPIYRHVYRYIQEHGDVKLPRAGRGKQTTDLDPERLPSQLTGALQALYGHYEKVFAEWRDGRGATPPVFIVVCNNTATSKLVFDWIAGYEKNVSGPNDTEQKVWVPGKLPLFSNVEDRGPGDRAMARRPVTLLIDSEELESGEALSSDFRKLAGPEIEAFKSDLRLRGTEILGEVDAVPTTAATKSHKINPAQPTTLYWSASVYRPLAESPAPSASSRPADVVAAPPRPACSVPRGSPPRSESSCTPTHSAKSHPHCSVTESPPAAPDPEPPIRPRAANT